jgi:hypothetical protein
VYAWERRDSEGGRSVVVAEVYNMSDEPIWEVDVYPRRARRLYLDVKVTRRGAAEIQPGSSGEWSWPVPEGVSLDPRCRLDFMDSAGRRWKKVGGTLNRRRRAGR